MTANIGVAITAPPGAANPVSAMVDLIVQAEEVGIPAVWLASVGLSPDAMVMLAAAAGQTSEVKLGTAIIPAMPLHPLALAQQVVALHGLAPGRLRLGVGTSHQSLIEQTYGFEWNKPHQHLGEYVTILKTLFSTGKVDFEGGRITARGQLPGPIDVPVMVSALRDRAFRRAGAIADGAITHNCPPTYLVEVALPALKAGAAEAHRPTPPLIAGLLVCVTDDLVEAREAARRSVANIRLPYYKDMLADAGFPNAGEGADDALIDELFVLGNEAHVAERMQVVLAMGINELRMMPMALGPDPAASLDRTMRLLGEVARA